ncbi:hypothetical protein E8E12_003583 [Didymella heteroderae]|uniref:Aminotransferase class I/classII large domain-containing protein n=1 Tax=Didymella heteroderae TaxID=1769908 RepID=A0A9P5BZ70_9PLEO|nr:hypothetical protein E8E12_003583 [Didymella heteroderae]
MQARLSTRGSNTRGAGVADSVVWEKCSDVWHAKTNPSGWVPVGLAENALMHNELREFLNSKSLVDEQSRALTYGDGPSGSKPLRHALTAFFNDYFHPAWPVKPEHLLVTNGVTSAVEHCAWNLANPGEGILLGRPYYRAFIGAMQLRAGVQAVPVAFSGIDPCSVSCVAEYELALIDSNARGIKIRALLLCHPNNPLGRYYSREAIVGLMQLCQKYTIHLIVDEIYALSTWENTVHSPIEGFAEFTSVLSIPTEGIIDANLVHVLWGASKDFGANGLRLGVMVSQGNPELLRASQACAYFSSPSSLAENAVRAIVSDRAFLNRYVSTNRRRMSDAYRYVANLLQEHGIEYKPGTTAAFFVWLDLGKRYAAQHPDSVMNLNAVEIAEMIRKEVARRKVFLVDGDAMGAEEPGWFRMVFTQPPEIVAEAVRRLANALQ